MKAKCNYDDCFTCPYPDCIADVEPKEMKPRMSAEEKKEKRRQYLHDYYLKRKEEKKLCK